MASVCLASAGKRAVAPDGVPQRGGTLRHSLPPADGAIPRPAFRRALRRSLPHDDGITRRHARFCALLCPPSARFLSPTHPKPPSRGQKRGL